MHKNRRHSKALRSSTPRLFPPQPARGITAAPAAVTLREPAAGRAARVAATTAPPCVRPAPRAAAWRPPEGKRGPAGPVPVAPTQACSWTFPQNVWISLNCHCWPAPIAATAWVWFKQLIRQKRFSPALPHITS